MVDKATTDRSATLANVPWPKVLFVGDADHREFREARACLDAMTRVRQVADVADALVVLEEGFVPEAIVVAQAFPDRFSIEEIDRLRRAAPLARLLGLLGSWCEGELRTGHPWPGVLRLYWHQFPAQCSREFARLQTGRGSTWGLPITAGDEERLLAAGETIPPAKPAKSGLPTERGLHTEHGLIVVWSRRFEMQDWLSTACRLRGYSTVWLAPGRTTKVAGAKAAIFDGCRCDEVEIAQIEELAGLLGSVSEVSGVSGVPGVSDRPVPIVGLLDFPRIEDQARAMAAGAAAVLSKPTAIDDLFWQLDRVITASRP